MNYLSLSGTKKKKIKSGRNTRHPEERKNKYTLKVTKIISGYINDLQN